jgi:hypothetical protein
MLQRRTRLTHRHVRCKQPNRKMCGPLRSHAAYAAAKRERCSSMTNSAQERLVSPATRPKLHLANGAAQTRIVSMARIWLGSRESARAFRGIIWDDISEFESHMPSHAVGLSQVRSPAIVSFALRRLNVRFCRKRTRDRGARRSNQAGLLAAMENWPSR